MNARNKILIVDDDPVNLDFFQLMLSKLGFTVGEATDGLDALEKLKEFYPDIILLDNIMPKMSGWELTKTLKEDPRYRDIPIIMFSALDDVKDKVAGFDLGVDDYITKPFNFSEVLARIKAILRTRELFTQIAMRESRLSLAEELNRDMRQTLADLAKGINDLDATVSTGGELEEGASGGILDITKKLRGFIEELDSKVSKTVSEWDNLKKNEIGLSALEKEALKFFRQEQR
ncbi:MAG: response regulator [Treponema sp.]|nr:response regulator [Treponema sp.]